MNIRLPLKEGERPLFSALQLLENAYRDYRRNENVFESIEEGTLLKMVTELYSISELLTHRENKGLRNSSTDLFEMLKELPLFFNETQVKSWEVEKKWNSKDFIPYKEVLINYENSFNTLNISSVYQANIDNNYIWQQWFIKTDIKELKQTIEDSAKRLIFWNKDRKEKTSLEKNLFNFSKYLNINKSITKNWYFLYLLGQKESKVWDIFLKELGKENPIYNLIFIWEKALELKTDSINSLIYDDSILVELGFFNNSFLNIKNWHDVWDKLNLINIPNINKKLINSNNFLKLFLKEFNKEDSMPVEWFSYIKNIDSISSIIKNMKNGKVLIYGKDLSGKKSLVFSILNSLNYNGYFINHKENKNEDIEKYKINELLLADKLLQNFNNSVLIIDNGEKTYDSNNTKLLGKNNTLQIWTMSNLSNISPKMLKSFDFVFEMESPPLNGRLELTNKIFKDKNLAFRIAQSVKEPSQILKIGKLCHLANNFSWDYISMLLYNFQKLHRKNDNILNLNKLEIDDNIVNLVGYPTLQENLNNIVQFYKNPDLYSDIGAKANKGILLVGPPGTGKTHFARNLSKIVKLPLFSPDTSVLAGNLELIDDLFNELKSHAPCILFLDEIDTLIANPKTIMGSIDLEKQKIVNTFLSHVDGIENNDGILIIGATHRGDNFDPAAIRSGRLSKVIHLTMPNEGSREEIWKEHLKNKKVDLSLNIKELLQLSVGFSCADIMESVNKAAILAVEQHKKEIDIACFKIACDEVFWGYHDSSLIINEKQKEITAYHEAGHTLIALYYGYDVPRVTIRPRESSLGATHFVNDEGIFNMCKEDVKKRVKIMLGGICAEKLIFGYYENGGTQDLSQAKKIVLHAICEAGLGNEGAINLGKIEYWSDERKLKIEKEEQELMLEQFENTEDVLLKNKLLLSEIAASLLEYKEISGEIMSYFKSKINEPLLSIKQKIGKDNHVLHVNKE